MSEKSKKILVVDDDPAIREVLKVNLLARGYIVTSVSTGEEALSRVFEMHPDIVLLDVMMPDLDGWEVLKVMRDHYAEGEIKILMLTAKSSDRDKMIGTAILKADEYITKPFSIEELLATIKRLLEEW